MLCIATPDPDSPIETYIRQHIRRISPGDTAVLYFQGNGESVHNIPSLRVPLERGENYITRHIRSLFNLLVYAYPGAISGHPAKIVKEFLYKNKVQSILAEFGPTGCALLPLCKTLGIRLTVNFHGHDATVMPRRWITRYAYRNLNKYADAFICGSKHFSETLINLGFSSGKIHVVPCGIDLDEFDSKTEKDPNLILAVGRFVEKKAPHLTIQAFERVLEKHPAARLEMIGGGPLLPMCEELVEAKGLKENVILYGVRDHRFVKQKMAEASLFVQHSVTAPNGDTESLGISLLEAMASKAPVVATRHNGFVETVQEGVTGFLVDERDVNGMAERMIQALSDKQLRDNLGEAGRKHVSENYEAGKIAKQMYALLRP